MYGSVFLGISDLFSYLTLKSFTNSLKCPGLENCPKQQKNPKLNQTHRQV